MLHIVASEREAGVHSGNGRCSIFSGDGGLCVVFEDGEGLEAICVDGITLITVFVMRWL